MGFLLSSHPMIKINWSFQVSGDQIRNKSKAGFGKVWAKQILLLINIVVGGIGIV